MPKFEPTLDDALEARYDMVREKIAEGLEQRHFVNWAVENTDWNLTKRQLRNYYKTVQQRLSDDVTNNIGRSLVDDYARHLERLDYLYRMAIAEKDWKLALSVAKEYAEFRELKNPENQPDWRVVANEIGMSTEVKEHLERLERLQEKANVTQSTQ